MAEQPEQEVKVLSTEDAFTLLQIKEKLASRVLINLKGKVTAVSEIFRIKKDLIFLIEVENILKILVKQTKYLCWQEQITPDLEYVFTNLQATTLQKGCASPTKVFVPWSRCNLFDLSDVRCSVISLEDWLQENDIAIPEKYEELKTSASADQASSTKFVSYQGTVTNCDEGRHGVYELDHRVGLYLNCLIANSKAGLLPLSSKIVVYNVHRRGFAMAPKIRLFCCACSCIRVLEGGRHDIDSQKANQSSQLQLLHSVYSLCATEVVSLHNLVRTMKEKLPSSSSTSLTSVLLTMTCCPWLQKEPRNLLQEFLDTPHSCCILKTKVSRIPDVMCIQKLCADMREKACDLTDLRQKFHGSQLPKNEINQQLYWSTVLDTGGSTERQALVGYLHCNPVTGQPQLQDATGAVDIVCLTPKDGSHACTEACLSPECGCKLTCPLLHPSIIRSVICVTKFKKVAERFLQSDVPNSHHIDQKYVTQSRYVIYLMFSLTDCVLLQSEEYPISSKQEAPKECPEQDPGQSSPSCKKRKLMGSDPFSRSSLMVYVTHKESLMTQNMTTSPGLRFCVLGFMLPDLDLTDGANGKNCGPTSDLTQLVQRNCVFNDIHSCDEGKTLNNISEKTRTSGSEKQTSGQFVDKGLDSGLHPVVLLFQRDVKWFAVLNTNSLYRISVASGDEKFRIKPVVDKMLKAVESSRARVCVQVPLDVEVSRIFRTSKQLQREELLTPIKFQAIDEILLESCALKQVNCRGRIISRHHYPQDTSAVYPSRSTNTSCNAQKAQEQLGVSVLDNQSVCLELQQLDSDAEVMVYMNIPNTSYPLGLLPGAVLELFRLERKVSRINKVYCQFTAVSTVRLCHSEGMDSMSTCLLGKDKQITDTKTVPFQYLVDLWRDPTAASVFQTVVYVCHFLKLALKSVCSACGSVVTSTGCSNPGCHEVESHFVAKVSVLVDDCTSPAVVNFANCPDNIQKLLRLSSEQWHDLAVATKEQGEVFLQQFVGEGDSVLDSFLIHLCNSQHVKRHLALTLKQGSRRAWKGGNVDINTMEKEDFQYRTIRANVIFQTRCLPYLQLECVRLEEADIFKM